MRRAAFIVSILMTAVGWAAGAQSNEFIDGLLAQEQASYGDAALLVLASAGLVGEGAGAEEALAVLKERGWAAAREAQQPVRLGEYSYLLMRVHGIRGGLLYTLFPGPRYATRELAWRQMVQGKARPGMSLSGERAMRILGRVLELQGGQP